MTDAAVLKNFYQSMRRMRQFEERLTTLSRDGILRGSLHLATGQEAVPTGACAALDRLDPMTVTYRGHGYVLAKGCDLGRVAAEILGRVDGLCGGKGGKMHLTDLSNGLLGANGIVGGGIPTAVGAALAIQIQEKSLMAMTVFGDGTLNQGAAHESFNMAGLWKLPVLFLCENNQYAEMTPIAGSSAVTELCDRMDAYGIPARPVDGNDPVAVFEAVAEARERAISGGGPSFIEARTYRTCGHYQADPGTAYRTKEEVQKWEAVSPLNRLTQRLKVAGVADSELAELDVAAQKEVDAAFEFALASPAPTEVFTDVFA